MNNSICTLLVVCFLPNGYDGCFSGAKNTNPPAKHTARNDVSPLPPPSDRQPTIWCQRTEDATKNILRYSVILRLYQKLDTRGEREIYCVSHMCAEEEEVTAAPKTYSSTDSPWSSGGEEYFFRQIVFVTPSLKAHLH